MIQIENDLIIIGAGAAGMFAAANLKANTEAILLEKKEACGKKLLIAGSGKCNISNNESIKEFYKHYNNPNFARNILAKFTNTDLLDFFSKEGLKTKTDKNGKVFPLTENSYDVLNILLKILDRKKIKIETSVDILKIEKQEENFYITTNDKVYKSKILLIATGGKSYPTTGSTGDGYKYAKYFGHNIIEPKPALTPVKIRDYPFRHLSGISLDNVLIELYRDNSKIASHRGDIGLTLTGISGPGVIDFSRLMRANDTLKINLINKSKEEFVELLINDTKDNGKVIIKNYMKKYSVPENLISEVMEICSIDANTKLANINKEIRAKIAEAFCSFALDIEKLGDFNVAMVTSGGVDVKEINPKTMESKIVKNLFFTGEVVDIDGETGGYNLQFAFSSAYLAAKGISDLLS